MSRRRLGLHISLVVALGALGVLAARARLRKQVEAALEAPDGSTKPLTFVPLPPPAASTARMGSGEIAAVALGPSGTWLAGGSGVEGDDIEAGTDGGLPTLRASALALWRGAPLVATEAGGFFRRNAGRFEEARTGFGTLHVRVLAETDAGELLVGAREGLFRAAYGSPEITRLDTHPVRSLATSRFAIVAGGEEGLFRVVGARADAIASPDSWIESVGMAGSTLFAATAQGLVRGPIEGPLAPVAGAEDVATGVSHAGAFWGAAWPLRETVRRWDDTGFVEERLPSPVLRIFSSGGSLLADTELGLLERRPSGWTLVRPRPGSLPTGTAHVSALALFGGRLVMGTFDGGLSVSDELKGGGEPRPRWQTIPGSAAWGVNALLSAGGELYVASLRGAARFDGVRLRPIEGPGAAFALAATRDGVAVGYAQGLSLPGTKLLSAFHGLPGNQVLALAAPHDLIVGTPSGLGSVRGGRVAWRVAAGESRLPHPWVTALVADGDEILVGTYGGGVARRVAVPGAGGARRFVDDARYEIFAETEGLKVNTGCLVRAGGRVYLGTDGAGLWRTSADGSRFERLKAHLPSPRVTALAATDESLFVGTDEGLARLALGSTP